MNPDLPRLSTTVDGFVKFADEPSLLGDSRGISWLFHEDDEIYVSINLRATHIPYFDDEALSGCGGEEN